MTDEHKRIVEIGGVKVEVDLRTAKRVDQYRVGDRVKVLKKSYGDNYEVHHGVIVAFDEFVELPTITLCYVKYSGSIEFEYLNAKSKDVEIAPAEDEVVVEKADIVGKLDNEIQKKRAEIEDIERKKAYFIDRFRAWFKVPESDS